MSKTKILVALVVGTLITLVAFFYLGKKSLDSSQASDSVSTQARKSQPGPLLNPIEAALLIEKDRYSVLTIAGFCESHFPDMALTIRSAKYEWLDKHSDWLGFSRFILSETPSDQVTPTILIYEAESRNTLQSLDADTIDEQKKLCSLAHQTFRSPKFDIGSKKHLIDALLTFKSTQK